MFFKKSKSLKFDLLTLMFAVYLPLSFVLYFLIVSEDTRHWFIFPILSCGVILAYDLIKWINNEYDILDPIGLISLFGFYFFFVVPILNVHWDYWMGLVTYPEDWRTWLGYMGIINFLGIIVYRITALKFSRGSVKQTKWVIDKNRMIPILLILLSVTGVTQVYFYQKIGGLSNLVNNFGENRSEILDGMGLLISVAEAFPILLMFLLVVLIKNKNSKKSIILVAFLLVTFFLLKMYFGGFRGSRNSTVWFLFWVIALSHNFIRPFTRKQLLIGMVAMSIFMYIYGFYKAQGINGLKMALNSEDRVELADKSGRNTQTLFLQDYGRSDIQALILYKLNTTDLKLVWGRSYLGDASILIPSVIIGEKLPTKKHYGTEALFYSQGLPNDQFLSSKIYGLAGEWMINFGFVSTPIAFFIFGAFVGLIRKRYLQWDKDDARRLVLPMFINLSFLIIINDLDNHIFFIFKNGAIALIFLILSKKVIKNNSTKGSET